ncbi:hypothetical protein Ahia01_000943500 [Argonauta hians]
MSNNYKRLKITMKTPPINEGLDKCSADVSLCDGTYSYQKVYYDVTDSCYYDFNVNLTYYEAKSNCEDMGGHLLTILSEAEQDFVVTKLKIGKSGRWIALEKTGENQWDWSYQNIQQSLNFSKLKDSGIEEEDKAFTQYNQWLSESVEARHWFVCEFDFKPEPRKQSVNYVRYHENQTRVTLLKMGYFIESAISCGDICLQTPCCTVYRFDSGIYECQLFKQNPTSTTLLTCYQSMVRCYMKDMN